MSSRLHAAMQLALIMALIVQTPLSAGAGGIHRWTDPDGSVHYGDRPPAAAESEVVKLQINTYSSPGIEALEAVFRTEDKVVMYSATWCGVCKRAKRYFEDRRIPFTEYDVETSAKGKRDYLKLGARGVPVILVGRRRLNGFSPAMFESVYRK
jgi:glutaredoxin